MSHFFYLDAHYILNFNIFMLCRGIVLWVYATFIATIADMG